ncbi:MAG: GNAT family N-acetyltransferase, partial [Tepidisphaeraceae bacterium]
IQVLGTRRGFRRRGLGRAMLLSGMHWLRSRDVHTALLGVDAASPTGAVRLYESNGFEVIHRRTLHVLDTAGSGS